MRALWAVLALMAGPVGAECFAGQPHQVTYDTGPALTIVSRNGDEVTVSRPDEAGVRVQVKHLMIFNRSTTSGGKTRRDHWFGHLPTLAELKPGAHFEVLGEMRSSKGGRIATELQGIVVGTDQVEVAGCAYPVIVIAQRYFMDAGLVYTATDYLSPEMLVILRSDIQPIEAGPIAMRATRIE